MGGFFVLVVESWQKTLASLVSGVCAATLGLASIPIWLTLVTLLALLRGLLLINQEKLMKNGGTHMKNTQKLNKVLLLAGIAETVWNAGTKIAAANI